MTPNPIIPLLFIGILFPGIASARPPGPPPPDALAPTLDPDRDRALSAAEIQNAAEALRQLDENQDGTISTDELRPKVRPEGRPPHSNEQDRDRPRTPPPSPLMQALDSDGDGSLSDAEISEAPHSLLALDADEDGELSSNEAGLDRRPPPRRTPRQP